MGWQRDVPGISRRRLIAAGGALLYIDASTVRKDIHIPGERVDSYQARPPLRPCPIVTRHLPLGQLPRVVADAITPCAEPRQRGRLIEHIARQLYLYTYPFWIVEYRRVQSWRYALGCAWACNRSIRCKAWRCRAAHGCALNCCSGRRVRWRWCCLSERSTAYARNCTDLPSRTPETHMDGLLIVGQQGGTNVGASLQRAAERMRLACQFVDVHAAGAAPRWSRFVNWRLRDHRPARLNTCSRLVVDVARQFRPRWVLATGLVPLNADALATLGRLGIRRLNYLTDDPWNPTLRSGWLLHALRQYDHVFSVRRANLTDLVEHGCKDVAYVPFGFDRDLFFPGSADQSAACQLAADVLFVGGADRERVPFIAALNRLGVRVAVYGDYWSRYPETRAAIAAMATSPPCARLRPRRR